MKRLRILLGAIALALASTAVAHGASYERCQTFTLSANGSTERLELLGFPIPTAWLRIPTAGAGSVSVAVNAYTVPESAAAVPARASFLMGTLNAANTYISDPGKVRALDATLSGCTNCVVKITLCGYNESGGA